MFTACCSQHFTGKTVKGGVEGVGRQARVTVDPAHPPAGVAWHTGRRHFLGAVSQPSWPAQPDLAHHLSFCLLLLVCILLVWRELQVSYIRSSSDDEHSTDSGLPVNKGRRTTKLPARQGPRSSFLTFLLCPLIKKSWIAHIGGDCVSAIFSCEN